MKGKVDILDLVDIIVTVLPPRSPNDKAPIDVAIVPFDKNKRVVIDESALEVINGRLQEQVVNGGMAALDPNTKGWIQEYVGKMVSELYRNGLVELEEIPDSPDDPYFKVRKWKRHR